ncbi:hypothetical protein [Cupriavidus neocaledonicus]|uniref:Uncharacterized protein n=1 Tax=Cupriavidus neocaledonicus TaxID=1040979 RepID=A0A375HKE5_9BURK|nr:hypothetical protein [Cupriavidus neocaledonicus]SOZ39565.1 conserved hypothetical protein [Cupriavidus neocaledonicus]SPD58719.1 conserved protein of unknown function [Cupriavidus neocaledonicus]
MRPSSLAVDTVPRRPTSRRGESAVAAPRKVPLPAPARIRLRLGVSSVEVFALRRTLHQVLGGRIRVYVVSVDYRHGETTMHVDLARADRDAAMHAIMTALPAAEFGATTALGDDHVAH